MGTIRAELEAADGDAGRVMRLTLAGETKVNAFDLAMRDSLIERLALCREHPDVGAVLVTAEGSNFSAGADLAEFRAPGTVVRKRWIRARRNVWRALWEFPLPIVVAMRGYAYGSGFELALLADIRVADPDTRFSLPEARLGMLPGAAGTQSLVRTVGRAVALELICTGRVIDGAEAVELGLVHRLDPEPEKAAAALAAQLAALPRPLAIAAKRALRAGVDGPAALGLAVERRAAVAAALGRR
ncbi:MAG TPA: enoyl-CoA hydratase/isomerase family protein [Mycobacteriales bacterium]|jgi:enoyl-CoA hydratase|nr:enoyl-CoA hydratase/isomerase family protein [Mycobacteriales bacterium]